MSADEPLAEKEFLLIQHIARNPAVTQRGLSEDLGLSLGMTNLIIRRLARKGLLKVQQLDWKRTQYLLTLKGAVEKGRKAYRYTLYTFRIFRQLQENIEAVLSREHAAGRREFHFVADDELLEVLKETAAGLSLEGSRLSYHRSFAELPDEADLVFHATLQAPPERLGLRRINLVDFDNIDYRVS